MLIDGFFEGVIRKWEGSPKKGYLSVDPEDSGNYHKGVLVGSNYGVTGDALAEYRGVKRISAADMKALTLAEAVRIFRKRYFDDYGYNKLPWNPVVASAADMGWGAGPVHGIKCLQRAARIPERNVDGRIGNQTILAVATCAAEDMVAFAKRMVQARYDRYEVVIDNYPEKKKYRNGWRNRTNWMAPGTAWWKSWKLDEPAIGHNGGPALELDTPHVPAALSIDEAEREATRQLNQAQIDKMDLTAEVLAKAPPTITERVATGIKVKLGEKSTITGALVVAASVLADPGVQKALGGVVASIGGGPFSILGALIGAGMVIYRQRTTPKVDDVIAAKRLGLAPPSA